jgi:hypothetical protein
MFSDIQIIIAFVGDEDHFSMPVQFDEAKPTAAFRCL